MSKAILALFLGSLLLQTDSLYSQYEWRPKACPVTYQGGGISFAIGTKAYVVGGDTAPPSNGNVSAAVWEYDATTDVWTEKNSFPHSANNPACFVINDTAYVGLGLDSSLTYHSDFLKYDQANDQWIPVANFPGSPRYSSMSFVLNGIGYIGCGHGASEYNDFYAYNPATNSWSQMADFPAAARQSGIGGAVGGKGYMGLGGYFSDIYKYNDTLNSWTQINSFTTSGRNSSGLFIINDTMYVIGGRNADSTYYDCWSYSVGANTWLQQQSFSCLSPDSVFIQDGFTINGHGYLRPLDLATPLHILLEFGPLDTAFTQRVHALGNDTAYDGTFTRVLSVPDSCALWSTGVSGPEITVSTYGAYWARWNVDCGVASDTLVITNATGIESVSDDNLIEAYPNPFADGNFTLRVDSRMIGSAFEIFDVTGRLVYRDEIRSLQTPVSLTVEAGIYSVRIAANNQLYVQKLVKL